MTSDELVQRLSMLPPGTDVVVDIGHRRLDVADIVDVTYEAEGATVALALDPADLRDAARAA